MFLFRILPVLGAAEVINDGDCYWDAGGDGRMFPVVIGLSGQMTVQFCKELCVGYDFAGVQNGIDCWCGNKQDYLAITSRRVADDMCNAPCRGNQNQLCGGGGHMQIFRNTPVDQECSSKSEMKYWHRRNLLAVGSNNSFKLNGSNYRVLPAETYQDCAAQCIAYVDCAAFVFCPSGTECHVPEGSCILKASSTQWNIVQQAETGVRKFSNSANHEPITSGIKCDSPMSGNFPSTISGITRSSDPESLKFMPFLFPAFYDDAVSNCASNGRIVAYPSTAEEWEELKEAAPQKQIWLGVTSVGPVHGNWVNEDGNKETYLNWLDGEPNNHGEAENCVLSFTAEDSKMNDASCSIHDISYVCEIPKNIIKARENCPSSECWTFDEVTQTCSLIPNKCVSLSCEATEMEMKMSSGLFGATPGKAASATQDLNLQQTAVEINGVTYNDGYSKVCTLDGDCDLSYEIVDGKLVFTHVLSSSGAPESLQLGDVSIVLSRSENADLSFKCQYGTSVTLESTLYSIQDVTASGTQVSSGSLDAGFSISLGSENVNLGDYQSVSIYWEVTSLQGIKFYVKRCDVVNGQSNIPIIKEGCISSVLIKEESYNASAAEISFDYKTFKIRGATVAEQTLRCFLSICMDNCQQPTRDDQCDQNSPFRYTTRPLINE